MIESELPNFRTLQLGATPRSVDNMRELCSTSHLPFGVESRLQRTPSLRPYVSPLLEKLTDTPFARKQLAFRFKLDDNASPETNVKPIQLASISFARQQVRGTLHLRPDLSVQRVFVRYTCDGWATFTDADATFIGNECYFFTCDIPSDIRESDNAVAFVFACQLTDRSVVWDNNNGANYCADVWTATNSRHRQHNSNLSAQLSSRAPAPSGRHTMPVYPL